MESKMENKTTCLQNENTIPASQKKKSGIPVPVKKCVQTRRPVLATVSEFQQNVLLNNASTSHKPAQTVPAPKSNRLDKRVRDESSVSSNGCKDAARNPDAPSAQGCKSVFAAAASAASDVHFKTEQKTPKALTAVAGRTTEVSASKTPSNGPDKLVSLLEEQQQCGIEFQKDGNALKSILTNAGIAVTASGTVSDMFRPQRMTEGQGRPVYTPAKHAALMRNSVYTKEPRMSLIDSCNQYKKFLRQTRGQEEQSESASPLLAKSPRKIAVSESPLLRGMKSNTVRGSVYPKWSHPGLCSPFIEPKSSSRLELSKPGEMTNHADVPKEKLGTPKTPVMAFRRVPISPISSRPRPVGGFVAGTPVTPLSAYSRVALTPAQRVPTQSSSKRDVKTEPTANPVQGSIKKKLRWADILSACSPDPQHTEQTEQRVPTSGSMTSIDNSVTHTSVLKPETEHRDPTSYRPMPTSAAKSAPQYPTPCTTVQSHKDSSPLVPPHGTEHPLHPQQNPPFSIRVRDFSAPLFPVHEGEEGDGQLADGRDGQRQRGAVCSSVHSTREWSSAYPGERGAVGNARESLSASASQRDILARLQVLEEQEHGIRNEMWLLRMAMKKQQEAANHNKHKEDGGDNIARPAPTQHQLRHSSTDHDVMMNQVSSFGDGASAFSTVGQGVRFELPQTGLWDCKSGSMPTQTSRMQTSHFSTSGSQGNTVSSTVYSEPSSYKYNVDSNVQTVRSETVKNPLANMPCDTAGLNLDTEGALPDIWPTWNMAIKLLEGGEFLWPHDVVASPVTDNSHVTELGNTDNDCEKVSAKDEEKAQHPSTDTMPSPACVSPNTSVLSMECEDMSTKKEEATFEQSCPPVSDQKMYDAQLHTEQQELDSGTNTVQSDANPTPVYSTLFLNNQGLSFQTNSQGVDMDVEETKDEATQSYLEISPATKKQSESLQEGEPRGLYSRPRISNPVSTIVQPRVMPSSPPQSMDIHISPPIWTTLALQSAAKHNSLQTSPTHMEHQQVTAASQAQSTPTSHVKAAMLQAQSTPTSQAQSTATLQAQGTPTLLPQSMVLLHTPISQAQNTATSQTHPHHTSPLLPRGDHAIKTEKDSSSVNNRSSPVSQLTETCTKSTGCSSNTPVYRAYAPSHSLSRRSPLHGTLRPIKHGRVTSSALKNADVFLEALVEDECALYAGRLQSFFRNPQVVCDRQETSDPVAKILTEGDHMHFLPVSDDPTFGFRSTTAFENSAFFTYVPV